MDYLILLLISLTSFIYTKLIKLNLIEKCFVFLDVLMHFSKLSTYYFLWYERNTIYTQTDIRNDVNKMRNQDEVGIDKRNV